jgi:predicted MPP superfamily phosphohydrolase
VFIEGMKLKKTDEPMRKRKPLRMIILIVLGCFILDAVLEPYTIEVKQIEISDPDVPASFRGFRIAFLTDIHLGPYFSLSRLNEVVAQVNGLIPDLVLLGGDYVRLGSQYIAPCFAALGKLKAPCGVYGVLGNHDHWEDADLSWKEMKRNGIVPLDNAGFWIQRGEKKIKIGGVGDLWTDRQDLSPTIGDARVDDFVILVSHNPDFMERLTTDKIDLVLCGHTHGGQVTFFGLYAPFLPVTTGQKYRTGVVDTPSAKVVISNGIGTVTPPVRFFAPPQIVVITLN